jgi:putative protease
VIALVTECDENGNAVLSLRNKFRAGDEVELVGPDLRPFTLTVPVMTDMDGNPLDEPKTPQMLFRMKLPCQVPAYTLVRHAVELSAK